MTNVIVLRPGLLPVTIDATQVLHRAIAFYERNGYAASGRADHFYGTPLYEYAKALSANGR